MPENETGTDFKRSSVRVDEADTLYSGFGEVGHR